MTWIRTVRGQTPRIHPSVLLAENAAIIGDVEIQEGASVWYNVTIRGDVMPIRIGRETNIQDGSIIHGTYGKFGTTLGDRVTIGHMVMLHGCTVGDRCLIGMGAVLMDGVEIGAQSIVGAGTLVTEGKKMPPRSLILGRPGKVVRELTDEELLRLEDSANNYIFYSSWYREGESSAGNET